MLVAPLALCWIAAVIMAPLDGRRSRVGWTTAAVLAVATVLSAWQIWDVVEHGPKQMVPGNWSPGVGIVLRLDALGALFTTLSLSVLLISLVYELLGGVRSRSFPVLILFMGTGLTGVFLTADIFNFYVFFEIAMISAYVLVSYGEERQQFRASAIFVLVNLLGSVFFLIGIAAIYSITGRLDMDGVAERLSTSGQGPVLVSATLLFVAFGIKLGIFPFHFWLASVYTNTRPAVAAVLSGALANIGAYGLIRFGGEILPRELILSQPALLVLGCLSVLYGGLQAIGRPEIPHVLAYSSIGQVGYILIALALAPDIGYAPVILFAVLNALNKTVLFLGEQLRGRFAGAIFFIGACSVMGLPPVAGFFGKMGLIGAAVDADKPWVLAVIVIGGLLSFVYLLQPLLRIHWAADDEASLHPSPMDRKILVGALALLILAAGIFPQLLLTLSDHAAAVLNGGTP